MSGILRFAGMLNTAVWLGAALFCSTTLLVAMNSRDAEALIGTQYFGLVSGAMTQIIFARLFHLHVLCSVIAGLHLVAEWMYLGRNPRRLWLGLWAGLLVLSLAGSFGVCPKVARLQRVALSAGPATSQKGGVQRSYRLWNGVFQVISFTMIGGVTVYFWRVTHAQDEPRFVSPSKFRG